MARVTIEDCLKRVNNRFLLVHLGARRVIQLRKGAKPLYDAPKNKEIVLALREIAAGEVSFESIEKIELDEVSHAAVSSPESAEGEDTSSQKAQEETPESGVEGSTGEENKQKDPAPDEAD